MTALPSAAGAAPRVDSRPVPMPTNRRGSELAMLCFAIAIMAFAFTSAGIGLTGHIPSGLVTYVAGFAVLMLAGHFAVRWLAPWADPLLLPLAALLNGLGIVMIWRLQESGRGGNPGIKISTISASTTAYQVMWSAIGIAAFIAVLVIIREPR